ncbi:hypothetical protein COCON_G00180600 [Conger conger]|uniref:Uncharacterized protein n=1 Tax=Conger conger TaxID=82655 RepID=A0A9Q1HSX7_CONCO|nr:hypothetical protein COCON_G00180600 [Conger conger]
MSHFGHISGIQIFESSPLAAEPVGDAKAAVSAPVAALFFILRHHFSTQRHIFYSHLVKYDCISKPRSEQPG